MCDFCDKFWKTGEVSSALDVKNKRYEEEHMAWGF